MTIDDLINLFFLICFIFTIMVLPNIGKYKELEASRKRFHKRGFG